jgi:hypothetical protein
MKNKLYLLLVIPLFAFALHNYHLSLTKIVKSKSNTLEITMRYFIDDIETTINKLENVKSELNTDRELKNIDSLLQNYILNNFKIALNNNSQKLNFIGKEYEKDIVFFYLETDSISKIHNIEIQNKMLLNTFNDQQNLVKINLNHQKKTFYLKNGNDKEMLKFN